MIPGLLTYGVDHMDVLILVFLWFCGIFPCFSINRPPTLEKMPFCSSNSLRAWLGAWALRPDWLRLNSKPAVF